MIQISEFGLKIKNIEAATLYEYNLGLREKYTYKDAMFANSLFKDYICSHGMKTWKDESTRDIICIEFNFGTRTFEEEIKHLKKMAIRARQEFKLAKSSKSKLLIQQKINSRKKISCLYQKAIKNKEKYNKLSKDDIRKIFYNDGVNVEYITRNRKGEEIKRETIHYKMLYRSTGKAKKGSCMFICNRLYKRAIKFLYMGIKLPKKNAPIVEISAYAPLISSGIVGRININPKNILILKDIDKFFNTKVVSIEIDDNKHCYAKRIDDYKLKNTMFDGQALIDSSIFPDWGDGYVLLRHHFCKMAAFNTNIQQFFKDYFKDEYSTATVTDMFGNVHYVKDIELITTDNAMKWLKFNVSYEYWCNKVNENDNTFGIVKTAHPSKLGEVQRMSYQMVNSLDYSIMPNVVKNSVEYVNKLKQDDNFFLAYLEKNKNFSNDYEVLISLCNQDKDFTRSTYFRRRKRKIIENYVFNMKNGHIIQDAENLVVVGSPYSMLLYGATNNEDIVNEDNTFKQEANAIQCYSNRFPKDSHLAFFRSPFNSKNNMLYLHNVSSDIINKYFNLGKLCIAINMNGTDAQDRANGMDMDSDSGYTTIQPDIVNHAKSCYQNYATIVNNIPKDKNVYSNTMDDFANMDNALSASQTDIGESSNLAQVAQSYMCNFDDIKYDDYTCILSVIAQAAIDNAKRRFDIDIAKEIRRIKNDMDINEHLYPAFWSGIKKEVKDKNINPDIKCPMNYLYNLNLSEFRHSTSTLPMSKFFNKYETINTVRTCKKVEELISKYSIDLYNYNTSNPDEEQYLLLRMDFENLLNEIRMMKISKNYIGLFSWLIDRAFLITPNIKSTKSQINSKLNKNKALLLKVLYEVNSTNLLKCFSKNVQK